MSEHTLSLQHLNKCGHEGCNCTVDPANNYCSEQCEQADSKTEKSPQNHASDCICAHVDCKQPETAGKLKILHGHNPFHPGTVVASKHRRQVREIS